MGDELWQLIPTDTTEDKDRGCDAMIAQSDSFFEIGNAEIICTETFQMLSDSDEAMPICVGFKTHKTF